MSRAIGDDGAHEAEPTQNTTLVMATARSSPSSRVWLLLREPGARCGTDQHYSISTTFIIVTATMITMMPCRGTLEGIRMI